MKSEMRHTASKKRKVVQGEIVWKICRDKVSGQWIGVCDPIGLTASGDTYSEAVENCNHAMDIVFKDLLSSGDLEEFLNLRGWKTVDVDSLQGEDGGIDAPFRIETDLAHDSAAAFC
jgi:predicted RNase H-like HicB family nuclease